MMLRALLIVLVIANVGYFLWSRADASAREAAEREPQRLGKQINPEWLQVRPPAAAPSAPTGSATPSPEAASNGAR